MEMAMAAMEDTDIAQDITPPISPLSFSLYDSLLHSHCSSCFSPLPPFPINSHSIPTPLLFYCSPLCSASDSSLHFSSAEHHLLLHHHSNSDSSDLRAALRFLQSPRASSSPAGRISGLLVNREKLMSRVGSDDDEVCERVRIGARAMAAAIKLQRGGEESDDVVLEEATVALCLVLTNAVEVQDNTGRSLGIAVYDSRFCYINHSCSPNACYRFVLSTPNDSHVASRGKMKLRIAPFIRHLQDRQEKQGYGPRIIVRSIKRIMKGEEVFVTYTDLLQPKGTRQLELWSKYRFICCCERCRTLPFTYVDHALQAISAVNLDSSGLASTSMVSRDKEVRLTEYIDEVISEYLSAGDPKSCCEKLEYILEQGLKEDEEQSQSQSSFKLHPLHHLSLNAYTTLASVYKVRACSFLSPYSEVDENQLEAFDMSRTSTAYSLLLANAAHHLFRSESSLIASVSNFWVGAGESLLSLSRSSGWSKFVRSGMVGSNLPSDSKFECLNCSLVKRFRVCASNGQIKSADYEIVSSEFLHCVTNMTQKVWHFLVYDCHFLRLFKDNIHFSWLTMDFWAHVNGSAEVHHLDYQIKVLQCVHESRLSSDRQCVHESRFLSDGPDRALHHIHTSDMGSSDESVGGSIGIVEDQGFTEHGREHVFRLGVHCLAYGGFLACICYGHDSHLTRHVQNILDHEGNYI